MLATAVSFVNFINYQVSPKGLITILSHVFVCQFSLFAPVGRAICSTNMRAEKIHCLLGRDLAGGVC